jgi:hypothetical protein
MWYSSHVVSFASLLLLAPSPLVADAASNAVRMTACDAASPQLPASVRLQDGLEPLIEWTLRHSPTFRKQCRALSASNRQLAVKVSVHVRPVGSTKRARTAIRTLPSRGLFAEIEIYPSTDMPELLGHEFEHVLEQLEGVDLERASHDGVAQRLADGAFETARALEAGRRVSGEVADRAPDRVRSAGARVWRAFRRLW